MHPRSHVPGRRCAALCAAVVARKALPGRAAAPTASPWPPARPFAAVVARKTLPDGAEYIRVVLGTAGGAASEVEDVSSVMDAEFLFLAGTVKGRVKGQ